MCVCVLTPLGNPLSILGDVPEKDSLHFLHQFGCRRQVLLKLLKNGSRFQVSICLYTEINTSTRSILTPIFNTVISEGLKEGRGTAVPVVGYGLTLQIRSSFIDHRMYNTLYEAFKLTNKHILTDDNLP